MQLSSSIVPQDIQQHLLQHRYDYTDQNTLKIQLTYIIGLYAVILAAIGFVRFLDLSMWYWVVFGPWVGLMCLYHGLNYAINIGYRSFGSTKHQRFVSEYWKTKSKNSPLIDIYLPVCGESIDVIERTFKGVQTIDYTKLEVYVLDDAADPAVADLAKKYNYNYIVRPDRGHLRKAGNLRHAFARTHGEYFIVFDADSVPSRDFVTHLLPYMSDPHIGIVQSPQYFRIDDEVHHISPIAYGAASLQQDFYRVIQVARDRWDGAICVGSNALYRRSAIESIGGPAQVDHGEDVHTGLYISAKGYVVRYIPVILALGLTPDTMYALYQQHNRWCSSSTGMFLAQRVLKARLSIMQTLCYYCGFLYYLNQMTFFVLPMHLILILTYHYTDIDILKSALFAPYVYVALVLLPWTRMSPPRYGSYLASITTVYTHALTVLLRLMGRAAIWVPTGRARGGSGYGKFDVLTWLSLTMVSIYISFVIHFAVSRHWPILNVRSYSVIIWIFWAVGLHALFLIHALKHHYEMSPLRDRLGHLVVPGVTPRVVYILTLALIYSIMIYLGHIHPALATIPPSQAP